MWIKYIEDVVSQTKLPEALGKLSRSGVDWYLAPYQCEDYTLSAPQLALAVQGCPMCVKLWAQVPDAIIFESASRDVWAFSVLHL